MLILYTKFVRLRLIAAALLRARLQALRRLGFCQRGSSPRLGASASGGVIRVRINRRAPVACAQDLGWIHNVKRE